MPIVEVWHCSRCREWVRGTETTCRTCGRERPADAQVGRKEMSDRLAGDKTSGPAWYCPGCRRWSPEEKPRCVACGRVRPADAPTPFIDDLRDEIRIQRERRPVSPRYPGILSLARLYRVAAFLTVVIGVSLGVSGIVIGAARDDGLRLVISGGTVLVASVVWSMFSRAMADLLRLAVDIEESTRRTAIAAERSQSDSAFPD